MRMKKWLAIVLTTFVFCLVAIYSYQKLTEIKIASLESIVPEDVIYYLYSYNLNKKIGEFQSSQFFGRFSSSVLYQKFVAPEFTKIKQKVPFLAELITKDTGFAIFSLGNTTLTERKDAGFSDIGDFLFLSRIDGKKHVKIRKSLADFYVLFKANDRAVYKKYKGIKITSYNLPDTQVTINYALLSDVLVVGNNVKLIQRSIDLMRDKLHSGCLLDSQRFLKLKTRIKKDSLLWGYMDFKHYYQDMLQEYTYNTLRSSRDTKGAGNIASFAKMKPFIDLMNILEGYVFYLDYNDLKSGFIINAYHSYNKSMDEDNILNLIAYRKEADQNVFRLIPRDIISYFGVSQDINHFWKFLKKLSLSMEEMMKAEMKNDQRYARYQDQIEKISFENLLNQAEAFLGISIEKDIIELLGNNFGTVFTDLEELEMPFGAQGQKNNFSFPQFYFFLELKDVSQMNKTMEKMLQRVIVNTSQFFHEAQKKERQRQSSLPLQQNPINQGVNQEGKPNEQPAQQAEPLQEKEYLKLNKEEFRETDIYTLEILDFPINAIKFNYCILDKYMVISLSPKLTKRVIATYKDNQGSISSNFNFKSTLDNMPGGYSSIMFFDFEKLIANIRATKSFSQVKNRLPKASRGKLSSEDLDSLSDVLSDINMLTFTNRMLDPETMESSLSVKIKGL